MDSLENKKYDHTIKPPLTQNFVCLSFAVSKNENNKLVGVRVGGVFNTMEEASAFSNEMTEKDPYYNVYVGEVGKFLPFNPEPHSKEEGTSTYQNETLNTIMKENVNSQLKAEIYHNLRVSENVGKTYVENLEAKNKVREDLLNKLNNDGEGQSENDLRVLSTDLENIDKDIEELEKKIKDQNILIKENEEKLSNFNQ